MAAWVKEEGAHNIIISSVITKFDKIRAYLLCISLYNLYKELAAVDAVTIAHQIRGLILATSRTLYIQQGNAILHLLGIPRPAEKQVVKQ